MVQSTISDPLARQLRAVKRSGGLTLDEVMDKNDELSAVIKNLRIELKQTRDQLAVAQGKLEAIDPAMRRGEPAIREILVETAKEFDVSIIDLKSPRRDMAVTIPRQVAMYLAKKLTSHGLPTIGNHIGRRDHTTVLHALRVIGEKRQNDSYLNFHIARLEARLLTLIEQKSSASCTPGADSAAPVPTTPQPAVESNSLGAV